MFDRIKNNLKQERKLLQDMLSIQRILRRRTRKRAFYLKTFNSLNAQVNLLNRAILKMLKEIKVVAPAVKKGPVKKKVDRVEKKEIAHVSYVSPLTKEKTFISLSKEDRKKFLEELRISEESLKKIKEMNEEDDVVKIKKPSVLAKFSNRLFRPLSERLLRKLDKMVLNLKKANIEILPQTYISMALFSGLLAFFIGALLSVALIVFESFNFLYLLIPFGLAGGTLLIYYFYPFSEASSVQRNIARELPFATIHMAAIAGADVAPSKIFRIIAESKEYKNLAKEMRKVTAQIDIYGYDLVTSLKNAASRTSAKKLAELFSGLATNISTGGNLKDYLEKKAENFLLDYKLERQKYTSLATTFMDIYISILIAAPLVLMMMLIVMNVAGLSMGMSLQFLSMLIVGIIAITNVIFLFILNMKQPKI